MPEPVDPRPALDEEAGYLPAAVSDGVIEWSPAGDRCPRSLNVGAVDKRSGHLDVVAARSPVQRSLFVPAALDRSVGIGPARPERSASNTRSELTSPEWTALTKAMAVPSAFDSLKP